MKNCNKEREMNEKGSGGSHPAYCLQVLKWGINMESGNILSGGIEKLNEIKEYLLELNGNIENERQLKEDDEKLQKAVKGLEKEIADEIARTIKKRKGEIEDSFDKQNGKIRDKAKKIKEQRIKAKSLKVSERIDAETAELRAEKRRLRLEAETVAKQNKIPFFCNSKLYMALYYPSCFTDILLIIAFLAIVLLLIPCGVYFLLLPPKIIYIILSYVVTVIVFGSLYLAGYNYTRERYGDKLKQIKDIRSRIRETNKKISAIKRSIKKDRDESGYGLHGYDEELARLEKEEDDLLVQKKEALMVFENTTSRIISNEIQDMYKDKLATLKDELEQVKGRLDQTEERIEALALKIASEYEPFLGKDLMTLDRLEALSNIILAGNAATISEAIAFYRQNTKSEKGNANG